MMNPVTCSHSALPISLRSRRGTYFWICSDDFLTETQNKLQYCPPVKCGHSPEGQFMDSNVYSLTCLCPVALSCSGGISRNIPRNATDTSRGGRYEVLSISSKTWRPAECGAVRVPEACLRFQGCVCGGWGPEQSFAEYLTHGQLQSLVLVSWHPAGSPGRHANTGHRCRSSWGAAFVCDFLKLV